MRIKKMTGLIYEIEATFIARNIRNDEFKFDTIIRFPIDLSNIADLSNYNLFLYDYFFNQNIDDLFIYDNPPDIEEFVTSLNNLTRCVLIDNIHKLEVHLRDESILDENEEILDIYDVTILDTLNLRVIEGEVLTVLSADVGIQGSVTRQGFQEVHYKESVDISCDCNENEYYVDPCDCERGYYEEGIHEEFVKEEIFEISDSCLTNIDISNADISNVDINDKESLINKLKQVYSEYIANTFNANYRDDSGICIHNKSTVEISNFTLNSIEIKRTLINCSSEEFKINYI